MAKCRMCGKPLSDPASIQAGMGPVCRAKAEAEVAAATAKEGDSQIEQPYDGGDIVLRRGPGGEVITNVPRRLVKHSPSGYEWGYGGSGPADLALNILLLFVNEDIAQALYQMFKWDFIAPMPAEGGVIKRDDIIRWLTKYGV